MKIFWDPKAPIDFTPGPRPSKAEKSFEAYLREAFSQGKAPQIERALNLVEEVLPLLERFAEDPLSRTQAETLAGILEDRAQELEALLSELPEGPVKETFSEAALFFGVEAEKLRRGFYV